MPRCSTNLNITDEQPQQLERYRANLADEQIVEVEALEIASREINAPDAAERLLELLAELIERNDIEGRLS